ncbi:bacterial alpha-L-rhamnosidase-domain-containing protein [Dactylonectria macrodidyma]|uniref:alpha-L-rhamnosidase n=1 Tax=Dactylonectria macrodidyma TaxID=307937 RepID=A0A9P9ERH5_9HYPO|nr:bacterial alpha-L-rhamnosidase-domain-containing protein [Dactylonectria macrodidyma]
MTSEHTVQATNVQFEHHRSKYTLGVDNLRPRISWKISGKECASFHQSAYEIQVFRLLPGSGISGEVEDIRTLRASVKVESLSTQLVPWPCGDSLQPRDRISVRVRVWSGSKVTIWSDEAVYETGLVTRDNWQCQRISATQLHQGTASPQQEHTFRTAFNTRFNLSIARARLYIAVQGVFQAEINGCKVSEDVLAPGWTVYDKRIRYQTYDVKHLLVSSGDNCLGVRLADGWFCGRLGFFGGRRHRWRPYPAIMAQLEIKYNDRALDMIFPTPLDGLSLDSSWKPITVLSPLPESVTLTAGWMEPVRPIETIDPVQLITTPSNKKIVDFGQNLVGYVRLKRITGQKGNKITLRHAEVLEAGELGLRPLRICEATDEYVCDGGAEASWEPSFTYHGFRYCQVDCPQRDERLGWTGDIAQFAHTAVKLYDCFGFLQDWLVDIVHDQERRGGVPAYDWLDPTAPPEQPMDGQTDPILTSDAFLIRSLDLIARIAAILDHPEDAKIYAQDAATCRKQFRNEYVSFNGCVSSDSQTAYALAICFDLLQTPEQISYAGERLATIVRRNKFRIGTGFAGTPFLCEALIRTGHVQVAYATLLCEECPSWLYPLTMTSFNHNCFGSVVSFLCERLGGLQCLEPGWKKIRFAAQPGGGITSARVKQLTPFGWVSAQWIIEGGRLNMKLDLPNGASAETVLPSGVLSPGVDATVTVVGGETWFFAGEYREHQEWPIDSITAFPSLEPPRNSHTST